MKVTVEDAGGCRKILHIDASAEAVAPGYGEVVEKYRKAAKLPGFRKGKAPADVVERRFAEGISEDARGALVPRIYQQALEQEGIKPEAVVGVDDVVFEKEKGITFRVTVDMAPEFKVPKYRRISVKENPVTADDEEVSRAFDHLLQQHALFEDVNGRSVQDGDLVQVDYHGECEGKAVKDFDPQCEGLGEGSDFWLPIGRQEFLPGFTEGLTGKEIGQSVQIDVHFPDDHSVAAVAGKDATYSVTVKGIRGQVLPELDEEFLKRFEVDSDEALRDKIRHDLLESGREREKNRQKDEISKYLLKKSDFTLPQAVVDHETQATARSMIQQMARSGASREQMREQQQAVMSAASQQSTDRVKLSYILGKIAAEENITVSDEEIAERIRVLAALYRTSPAQLRSDLEKRDGIEEIAKTIRDAKTLDFLLGNAKIKK